MFRQQARSATSAPDHPAPTGVLERLAALGDAPEDERDLRLRKHAFALVSAGLLLVAVLWILIGLLVGRPLLTILSAVAFGVAVLGIVAGYRRSKHLLRALRLLLVAGLAYVATGHALLGGLAASGGVLAWGVLVPVLALLLFDAAAAMRWLLAYIVIVAAAVAFDPLIVALAPASWVTPPTALYAYNVLGPALIIVALVRHVDGERLLAQLQYHGLLLRILPAAVVERLNQGQGVIAQHHASVTVVFADIAGFTAFADDADPDEVLIVLNELFSTFDRLAAESGVEKIKTIGDAYMAVAGAPVERDDHADAAMRLAIAMQRSVADMVTLRSRDLAIRIGLASGPVTAGVIGTDKPAYDVWGDTVNLASRMESTGVVGQIQIAEGTRILLRRRYALTRRPAVSMKGKGMVSSFLLDPAGGGADHIL